MFKTLGKMFIEPDEKIEFSILKNLKIQVVIHALKKAKKVFHNLLHLSTLPLCYHSIGR
jgi:hypothetical protein